MGGTHVDGELLAVEVEGQARDGGLSTQGRQRAGRQAGGEGSAGMHASVHDYEEGREGGRFP